MRKAGKARARRAKPSGAHPVGAAVGAAGGAAAGAVVGSLGGPIGTAIGATVGGVAGGLAGREIAESVNPAVEDAYWRAHYQSASYVQPKRRYEYYQPAYRFGWESYSQYGRRSFEELEDELARQWEGRRRRSLREWAQARGAVRDAFVHASDAGGPPGSSPAGDRTTGRKG